ncbi:MAG TPA: DNA polymerase III subunit delta' [Casimicrobiaceae bacterium]
MTELLPWQRDAAAAALAARARWPHALLLEGPRGIGKRALALHFARALLCESPSSDGAPCGRCPSCGYVDAGAHPDLRVVEPIERDEDGNETPVEEIVVDRIRELIDFTQLSAHRQGAKVAIIIPAERLNAAAANALLKTLEEPPPATYLMLVSHQPGRLRATLVSRCLRFLAPRPEPAVAMAWLAQQGVAQPDLLLAQGGGAPLLAAALADPAVQREREFLIDALSRPHRFSPVTLGGRIDGYRKDERKAVLADVVYWLTTWVADLATSMNDGPPRFHPDRAGALAQLGRQVARLSLFRYYQMLLRQRGLLGHPLTPRLVAEAMLFEYQGLFTNEDGG